MTRAGPLGQLAQHARESLHGLLGSHTSSQDVGPAIGAEPELDEGTDLALQPAGTSPDLAGLQQQIARLGREQFKLSSLVEMQQQNVHTALEQLREQDARREREREAWSGQREADRAEARLELVQRWLPVLDGLDNALAAGRHVQQRLPLRTEPSASPTQPRHATWYGRLIAWPVVVTGLVLRRPPRPPRAAPSSEHEMADWLRGLELVRERCLVILAAEGVRPIETIGQPFDPNFNVAMDTTPADPDVPTGTIIAELRRGYAAGARVLRYAEVIVARASDNEIVQKIVASSEEEDERPGR